jgi:predicted alpha/beta-fold hydrolase
MPLIPSNFTPAWWLPGHHLPTLWPSLTRRQPDIPLTQERVELSDGDFLDLSWYGETGNPVVILLHGLEGSIHSPYAKPVLKLLSDSGYHACMMHFRGCSGEPNRLPRSYHSGDSAELQAIVRHIHDSHNQKTHAIVAFSLGANILLEWLGEQGSMAPVNRAVAVSVPFLLDDAADRLDQGFSRIYQQHLLRSLKKKYTHKVKLGLSPLNVDINSIHNFRQFDELITAPLHGFAGADDYYQHCSCRQFIPDIRTPTLILHDKYDPFMWPTTIPAAEELPADVYLELTEGGGHVGFIQGNTPINISYWTEKRLLEWLEQ